MKRILILFLLLCLLLTGCGIASDNGQETACGVSHVDADDNGECDLCCESVMTTFDFYAVNDLHGKLADGDNHPGVDELSTYLKNARQTDDNVVFLSAGDMWQGSAESNMTNGIIITDWMNELGFTAMTMGNHEYDWGSDAVRENADCAEFPFLAINIYDRETDSLVDYCQPSVMVDADGIQIGIIGAIGDCYSSISADKVEDIYFKSGVQLTALVKAEADRLREEGADFIIYCLHDGSEDSGDTMLTGADLSGYYDLSLSEGYVDLVFEGHTHQGYAALDGNGVYHLQNRGDNKGGICHVEIAINTVTGGWDLTVAELVNTGTYSSLDGDPIVEDLLAKYEDQISSAYDILGTNGSYRESGTLRQKVAELYYELGVAEWGEEYDIALGGGFISVRSPYVLRRGDVTYADLQSLFPFDNDIVLCSIRGSDLLSRFINTNNSNYYISNGGTSVSGKNIDPDGIYYVVVDTYTASYAPNRLTVVEEYETGVYARDLLADFIMRGGYSR